MVRSEEQPVITDTAAKDALPLCTLKGLYISLERVGGQLVEDAGYASLNGSRESAKVLFSIRAESTDPAHSLFQPRDAFSPRPSA